MSQHDTLFGPEIEESISRAGHVLCCLDFDGTLTPLVDDPKMATLSGSMHKVLRSLANRRGLSLAVISGRALDDLKSRVGIEGMIYAGNHGLEIHTPQITFVEPSAAACAGAINALAGELAEQLKLIPGAFVEDKGLTLSVHYRTVAAHRWEEVRQVVHARLARSDHPFQLSTGKHVYEIRPRVDWHKGAAVRWIVEQLGTATDAQIIYIGDDTTDEDVFDTLPTAITIKVGDEGETAAHYQVDSPADVQHFLHVLDELLHRKK